MASDLLGFAYNCENADRALVAVFMICIVINSQGNTFEVLTMALKNGQTKNTMQYAYKKHVSFCI